MNKKTRGETAASFFNGKKVFVTGHTGFKGAWLTAWLLRLGAEVTGYALPPNTKPSLFEELGLQKQIHNIFADVRDLPLLQKAVSSAQPDIILHLAAQPLVRRSYEEPLETLSANVMGAVHILHAARALAKPCALVNVTTDKVYFNPETGKPLKETDPLGGLDPYSCSKAMSEQVTACWRETLGLAACATARAGNVIGGGDWAQDRLAPSLFDAWRAGKPAVLRRPDAVRPWQYVTEPLYGYLLLGAALYKNPARFARAWNFGPSAADCLGVKELAENLRTAWGGGKILFKPDAYGREAGLLRLNSALARKELGWRPVWRLSQTAVRTAQWYRRFYAGESAKELVHEELAAYEAALAARP